MPDTQQPVIVLVSPQLPENIGMCARAMLNCGLKRLRLVTPRKHWPHDVAYRTAAGADEVLDQAGLFASLDEAIADCQHVVATTARSRALHVPILDAEAVAQKVVSWDRQATNTAIVFGTEASGLDSDMVSRAECVLRFATNPDFPTLNLAQSVLLFAWEWSAASGLDDSESSQEEAPAPHADLESFFRRLEGELDVRGFFLTPELRPTVTRTLRSLFSRMAPASRELALLHGLLTALMKEADGGQNREKE